MRRKSAEMPLALALVASALIHAAALLGPGWMLPGFDEGEGAATIDAVLTRPAARREEVPVAAPAPRPPVDKLRRSRVTTAAPVAEEPAPASEPSAPRVETPPPVVPVAAAPLLPPPVVTAPVPPVAETALPAKGRVRYVITRGEGGFVVGQTVHTWEHDGVAYTLQSVTETTGLAALFKPARVVLSSRGDITPQGLRPREFRHERVGGLDTASFDWTRGVVAYAGRDDSIVAGTQDMLSMYYQLVLLAPQRGVLVVPIATGRKLESFRFEVVGEEVLQLPAGERRAAHLRTRSGKDSIDLWIAPGVRGLPLKIRFTDREGEIFDQLGQDIDIQETQ
jgi:hypothetical protein